MRSSCGAADQIAEVLPAPDTDGSGAGPSIRDPVLEKPQQPPMADGQVRELFRHALDELGEVELTPLPPAGQRRELGSLFAEPRAPRVT
jgi:hypothetical protein